MMMLSQQGTPSVLACHQASLHTAVLLCTALLYCRASGTALSQPPSAMAACCTCWETCWLCTGWGRLWSRWGACLAGCVCCAALGEPRYEEVPSPRQAFRFAPRLPPHVSLPSVVYLSFADLLQVAGRTVLAAVYLSGAVGGGLMHYHFGNWGTTVLGSSGRGRGCGRIQLSCVLSMLQGVGWARPGCCRSACALVYLKRGP